MKGRIYKSSRRLFCPFVMGKQIKCWKGLETFFLSSRNSLLLVKRMREGESKKKQSIEKYWTKTSSSNSKSKKVKNFYGYRAVARSFISPLLFHSEARLIREIKIKSRFFHVLFHCVSACFSLSLSFHFVLLTLLFPF